MPGSGSRKRVFVEDAPDEDGEDAEEDEVPGASYSPGLHLPPYSEDLDKALKNGPIQLTDFC